MSTSQWEQHLLYFSDGRNAEKARHSTVNCGGVSFSHFSQFLTCNTYVSGSDLIS